MKILSVREKKANERKILIVFERNEVETCNFHHSKELMKECKARQIMHTYTLLSESRHICGGRD